MISRFENIRVVLVEPSKKLREEIKASLVRLGFRDIVDSGNLSMVEEAITQETADLLIVDTSLPEGDVNDLIYKMRHGKLGRNPFLVVVTLVANPMAGVVNAAIDSGADDIAIKPFSMDYLCDRILSLTHTRKRFVVTTDYIGPDRRDKRRVEGKEIPQNIVPNPLRMRVTGQVNEAKLRRAIDTAAETINEQKVERHGYQIQFLLKRILPALKNNQKTEQTTADINRLVEIAEDMSSRSKGSIYSFVGEKCMTLLDMVTNMQADSSNIDPFDMNLLSKLGDLIKEAVDPERNEKKKKAGKKEEERLKKLAEEESKDDFFNQDEDDEDEGIADQGEDAAAEEKYMAASA